MNNRLRTVVIIVVTLVWGVNFTAPVWQHGYTPSPELNVAFMAIVGYLTATYKKDEDKKDGDDNGD